MSANESLRVSQDSEQVEQPDGTVDDFHTAFSPNTWKQTHVFPSLVEEKQFRIFYHIEVAFLEHIKFLLNLAFKL